jgi:hypothetical protein
MHTVQYDDGEVEQLALAFEDWIFAEHLLPGQQQAPGLPLAVPGGGAVVAGQGPSERFYTAVSGQGVLLGMEQGPVAAPRQGAAQMLLEAAGTQAEGSPPQLVQQPQQLQHPAGVGAPGPLPAAAVPAAVPAAAAGGPAGLASAPHQQQQQPAQQQQAVYPQQLVASGRNYRAFTASAPPPGFEIFCLLPGLSIEEVSGWVDAATCLCGSE